MKRVQCLPINTATSDAYGLLGIRPIQQEPDLENLHFLVMSFQTKTRLNMRSPSVNGWMDGWVGGLMDGWMDGWVGGWVD